MNKNINVITQSCPLFVPIIEAGFYNDKIADQAISLHLEKLKNNKIDALVLGCTHYPILYKKIKNFLNTKIIDSPKATSHVVNKFLDENQLHVLENSYLNDEYYVSDQIMEFNKWQHYFLLKKLIKPYKLNYKYAL